MLIRLTWLRSTAGHRCTLKKARRSLWQSPNSNDCLPVASTLGVRVQNSLQKVLPGIARWSCVIRPSFKGIHTAGWSWLTQSTCLDSHMPNLIHAWGKEVGLEATKRQGSGRWWLLTSATVQAVSLGGVGKSPVLFQSHQCVLSSVLDIEDKEQKTQTPLLQSLGWWAI